MPSLSGGVKVSLVACLAWLGALTASADEAKLKRLIDQIARGSESEAADATDVLLAQVVDPVADAVGVLESRPFSEQIRIYNALTRLHAALGMRLFRARLPGGEREVFDRLVERSPRLVERLFHEDPRERSAALQSVPLEPNAGGGVLIVSRVFDSDLSVSQEALSLAARLHDRHIANGLTRALDEINRYLTSGLIGPTDEAVEIALVDNAEKAMKALAQSPASEAAEVMIESTRLALASRARGIVEMGVFADALGSLGDERAAPILLTMLDDERMRRVRALSPGGQITQTVGDAALLALLRIYKLDPQAFGVRESDKPDPLCGFEDAAKRKAGQMAFRAWHHANAARPAAQREPAPASQPAEKGPE